MRALEIPHQTGYFRGVFAVSDLLQIADSAHRTTWRFLTSDSGIYVVYGQPGEDMTFQSGAGSATHAIPVNPHILQEKWNRICACAPTDIIYIGKGDNLRKRIRCLSRFGVGKASNHHGGEWLWQMAGIETGSILVQSCPAGQQIAFENWLLEQFFKHHCELPLANRIGPKGDERWWPVNNLRTCK